MPTISKIRFTNVVYEGGNKRYADEIFHFQGENSAIVLENGGGKTVFIQTALQAIIPHIQLGNRKAKETFVFDDGPAHIAIEWIKNDRPRIYALTAITIFPQQTGIDSYRYVYEYSPNDEQRIEKLPFTHETKNGQRRIASHAEMKEYYAMMSQNSQVANTFSTITSFTDYIEKNFQIIADEWKSISTINAAEGDVEKFFEECKNEKLLYEKLLIPTVEQSIAAFEKHQFVDIFEKHRDQFKVYKQLSAQLKEYDSIQKALLDYVADVKVLYELKEQYEGEKLKGKAYFELLKAVLNEIEQKLAQHVVQQQQLQEKSSLLERKKKSYDIAVIEESLQQLTAIYEELENNISSLEAKLDENNRHFGNLKYANEQQFLLNTQQQLQLFMNQLSQLDENFSTDELLTQLEDVKAKIHGDLLTQQERYEKDLNARKQEHRKQVELLEKQRELIKQLIDEEQQYEKVKIKLETQIEQHTERAEEIAGSLFENDLQRQQPVLAHRNIWTNESQQLDEQIVQIKNKSNQFAIQKQQHEERLATIHAEQLSLKVKETTIKQKITAIDGEEQTLREQVASTLPRVSQNTTLYLKEATLLQDIKQAVEKKEHLYTNKLHMERLAHRFVDDYGEQQSFFADTYVAKKLPVWSQRFSYLETAIDYAMEEDEFPVNKELLAITLITTDEEKSKLEQLIIDNSNYLTYPIQIWTLSEAVAISKGDLEPPLHLVQPTLWQQLRDLQAFQLWQQQSQEAAKQSRMARELVEKERTQLANLLTQLENFFKQYPLTYYQRLEEELKTVQQQTYEISREQGQLLKEVDNLKEELEQLKDQVEDKQQLKQYYDGKIKQLLTYEKLLRDKQHAEQELAQLEKKLATVVAQMAKEKRQEVLLDKELEETNNHIHSLEQNFSILVAERYLYKEVKTTIPKFTNEGYDVLVQQYKQIDNEINGINANRQQVEQLINREQAQIKTHEKNMQRLHSEYSNIDEKFELPLDYEQQLEQLPRAIKALQKQRTTLAKERDTALQNKNREEGVLKEKLKDVAQPIRFEQSLATVKYQLEEESKRLKLQQEQLLKAKSNLDEEKSKNATIFQSMQILDAKHSFLAPTVTVASLTVEDEKDFNYRPQHYLDVFSKVLKDLQVQMNRQSDVVGNSKERFVQFCTQHVSDVRLRHIIIDGVKAKETYEDLVMHQQEMLKTIHSSRQYAQQHIKKHDDDLVQFVQRVHMHLRKVVEELKHIPRKTKVHANGEDVDIYRFTIPEWSDEEGLTQIRSRIDWIMEQLEQIENRAADEQDRTQKSRKQLEEWLSTVQLLRVITQNKEWRVACRKVMNDNRISKNYYSWSTSNAWSGGEKWSKNMALFLGVLNYVAEKRQYISSKKKSRTVILDNPFGKASSDHVLSPVFFIAKQLGFQIIALTAHVEGKFLHDYFPVVYSCRLRAAVGTDKLVMETKKTMHQAFFQDHNEDAGEGIEAEQLKLFVD